MTDHDMILAYRAKDAAEAALLTLALEAAGIRTVKAGGQASLAFGDLPSDAMLVDIWVPKADRLLTRKTIEEAQLSVPEVRAEWDCSTCGESNGGGFEFCWSCQSAHESHV